MTLLRLDVMMTNSSSFVNGDVAATFNDYNSDEYDADFGFQIMGMTGWNTIEELEKSEETQNDKEEHPEIVILN